MLILITVLILDLLKHLTNIDMTYKVSLINTRLCKRLKGNHNNMNVTLTFCSILKLQQFLFSRFPRPFLPFILCGQLFIVFPKQLQFDIIVLQNTTVTK